jgi:uncharacterized membrane protein YoaK (UPF0700 family)
MTRADKEAIVLAMARAFLSGLVDALGYLQLGGFFVSFMTGNSTRLGIDVARGNLDRVTLSAVLIVLFVVGVVLASFVRRLSPGRGYIAILTLVTLLLAAGAALFEMGNAQGCIALMTLAMGAENLVFEKNGDVTIGVTYMTGTLVKLGQKLADTLRGVNIHEPVRHFLPWFGVVLGAIVGGMSFFGWGLHALWIAAAISAALTVIALTRGISERFAD